VLADALARGEARHFAVKDNLGIIDAVRTAYRKSGGTLPRLTQPELAGLYERRLATVNSLTEFKQTDLDLAADLEALSPRGARATYDALPSRVSVRDRDVEIDYDVEEENGAPVGVARLQLPEKVARTLTQSEVPTLDRPVRFVVYRGQRGQVRARTLDELQVLLDAPWTDEEVARFNRKRDEQRDAAAQERRDRLAHGHKRQLRDGRPSAQRPGKRERDERSGGGGGSDRPPKRGGRGGPRREGPGGARPGGRPGGKPGGGQPGGGRSGGRSR
jgi:ATP-dependent helicase HrpA